MEPAIYLAVFTLSLLVVLFARGVPSKHGLTRGAIRKIVGFASVVILAGLVLMPIYATTITEYVVPGNPGVWDLSVNGTSSLVWYTESAGNNVGRLDYSTGVPMLKQIPIPTANSYPWGITTVPWPNAAAVFTESYGNKIGAVAKNDTHNIAEYTVPTYGSGLRKIIYDWYRNCTWFTEYASGKIGKFSFPDSTWHTEFVEYTVPWLPSNPIGIAIDRVGPSATERYIWVADFSRRSIVRFHPESGTFREYSVDPFSPWDVTVDIDGMVWFTAQKIGTDLNVIGRLNPIAYETSKWSLTTFSVPTPNSEVHDIEVDSHGYVWFTEFADYASKIGRYSPLTNVFTEYPIITPNAKPQGLANCTENDGTVNVWFTEYGGRRIGRLRQPEGPTVSTTVYSITKAVTTSRSVLTVSSGTTTGATSTVAASTSVPTVTSGTATTASSTIVDTISIVLTSPTYWTTTRTSTTSTSFTTTTSTYKQTSVSTETTSTTTSATSTYVSTSWESVTTLTTATVLSISWFSETTSTTTTQTQNSTIFSPTITTPTTTTMSVNATLYSPTVSMTSTTLTVTSTTTTSTTGTTATSYSPTVTVTSTATTLTTFYPIRPCIIASAAYGSELAPEVQLLRVFRDKKVLSTFAGAQFMKAFNAFYYSFSPFVAESISTSDTARAAARVLLVPLLGSLNVGQAVFHASEVGALAVGLISSSLIGLVYISPFIALNAVKAKNERKKRGVSLRPLGLVWIGSLLALAVAEIGYSYLGETTLVSFIAMTSTGTLVLSTMILAPLLLLKLIRRFI